MGHLCEWQIVCHCDERSDAAISIAMHYAMEIASLRSQ
jgi:hypothetical protein